MTTRTAIYLRVSLDATGERLAVARQREDCERIAADRGWEVVETYTDNSVSASKRTVARPAYERMVQDYAAGRFDALVCWDLDRLTRQPRQLEDWIDAAEERGLMLVTANGEADLSTDGGRLFARIKASVARAEVERKSARQKRAAAQRADRGKPPAGVRLTGYTVAGDVVPDEAETVRAIFARFDAGDSLRGITVWLAEQGHTTRRGAAWNPSTVRTILTNPRYAGRAVYRGEVTGQAGTWQAIVDEATFDSVQARLTDPRRITNRAGTDRKHLGSGLYRCGVCGGRVRSHSGGRYRCPEGGHITRMGASIDAYVTAVIRARLKRPDAAEALAPHKDEGRAAQAASDVARLRSRLAQVEADYDAGHIDGRRFAVASEKVRAELSAAEAARAALTGPSLAALLTAPAPGEAFDALPLGSRREVVDLLAAVTLNPAERGRKFRPNDGTVDIEWRS
ncbi:recombinase family protein [Serinicoccus kebangsaanensis]|uniref:recombinase family protein n=1 Tax=Serinicoccus kebangsaanensis TaxID=2602069 RepID=UPI00124CCA84|nr:recombinase family protein [Serinicoccus kebangsaanensis]